MHSLYKIWLCTHRPYFVRCFRRLPSCKAIGPDSELQGRLPIRVELNALSPDDFKRILSEPKASLCEQYQALLGIENIELFFTDDGIARIAELAWQVNEGTENIGARRLHTVMERLLEEVSFNASELEANVVSIDQAYVDQHLAGLVSNNDLSRFIL